jgi:hypothetical protein
MDEAAVVPVLAAVPEFEPLLTDRRDFCGPELVVRPDVDARPSSELKLCENGRSAQVLCLGAGHLGDEAHELDGSRGHPVGVIRALLEWLKYGGLLSWEKSQRPTKTPGCEPCNQWLVIK